MGVANVTSVNFDYITYGQSIICSYMMKLGPNFIMREVASSTNSCANCHYNMNQDTFST